MAAFGDRTATAEALLKAGADVNATNKVRSNMLVAIMSIVFSFALLMAFQHINMSTICLLPFSSNADNTPGID